MTRQRLRNVLVTGGTGFIGNALLPLLLKNGYRIIVIDHSSTIKLRNLENFRSSDNFDYFNLDLLNIQDLKRVVSRCHIIFHLAANVEVREGQLNTEIDFLNNIVATRNILECMRLSESCKKIIFTSSSVVYGEHPRMPTTEDYGPLEPVSLYGASKLACEALISGYAATFGLKAVIFRLANIVGPDSGHGVIHDFFLKLKESKGKYLEILGDGKQNKSYLYIDDCLRALMLGLNDFQTQFEIFNVGSDDQINTDTIAKIIINQLGLHPKISHSPGSNNGKGWVGDIKNMLLSTEKIKKIGWKINYSSKDSVTLTVKNIIKRDSVTKEYGN